MSSNFDSKSRAKTRNRREIDHFTLNKLDSLSITSEISSSSVDDRSRFDHHLSKPISSSNHDRKSIMRRSLSLDNPNQFLRQKTATVKGLPLRVNERPIFTLSVSDNNFPNQESETLRSSLKNTRSFYLNAEKKEKERKTCSVNENLNSVRVIKRANSLNNMYKSKKRSSIKDYKYSDSCGEFNANCRSPKIVRSISQMPANEIPGINMILSPDDPIIRTINQHYYPESGWGLIIVFCASMMFILTAGLNPAVGFIVIDMVQVYRPEEGIVIAGKLLFTVDKN